MNRVAVLVVGEDLDGHGGLARVAGQQRRILEELGWEVTAVTPASLGRVWSSRKFPALNPFMLSVQLSRLARRRALGASLALGHGMVGAYGIQAPRIHLYHGTMVGLARACKDFLSPLHTAISARLSGSMERRCGRSATCLAVSQRVAQEVADYYGVRGARVIYNAVDPHHFRPAPTAGREQHGAAAVGLYLGRLDYGKGRETVQRLGAALPERYRLRLAVPHLAGRLDWGEGRLEMLGAVDYADLPPVYQQADYVLCPSRYEGFGLTAVEAWACGKPIVSTDVGIISELRHEESALNEMVVDDVDDAAGLAARIQRLDEDPDLGRRQAEWGRSLVEERFSYQRMKADYVSLLGDLGLPVKA